MVATAVTVTLLVLDVLVVVLLLELLILAPFWLLRRRRRRRMAGAAPVRSGRPDPATAAGFGAPSGEAGERKRRCDSCRSSWTGRPGTDASIVTLWIRRRVRRRARARSRPAPAWAARQGWDRCPSCFSTAVRDSRRQEAGAR